MVIFCHQYRARPTCTSWCETRNVSHTFVIHWCTKISSVCYNISQWKNHVRAILLIFNWSKLKMLEPFNNILIVNRSNQPSNNWSMIMISMHKYISKIWGELRDFLSYYFIFSAGCPSVVVIFPDNAFRTHCNVSFDHGKQNYSYTRGILYTYLNTCTDLMLASLYARFCEDLDSDNISSTYTFYICFNWFVWRIAFAMVKLNEKNVTYFIFSLLTFI